MNGCLLTETTNAAAKRIKSSAAVFTCINTHSLIELTNKLNETHFEKVMQERHSLSITINALLYALAVANPDVLREEQKKMGASLDAVMAEIGYVDKKVVDRIRKEVEDKLAISAKETEMERIEKQQITLKAEADKAQLLKINENERFEIERLRKKQVEAAIDMLRLGTPIASVVKWTDMPEDEVKRLKAKIDISVDGLMINEIDYKAEKAENGSKTK